jgi:hypothetical protein
VANIFYLTPIETIHFTVKRRNLFKAFMVFPGILAGDVRGRGRELVIIFKVIFTINQHNMLV